MGGDESCQGAAQQDAGQQARHHGSHRRAAPPGRRQVRRQRDDLLGDGGGHAEHQGRRQGKAGVGRESGCGQGRRQQQELPDDQPPPLREVAQRHQEKHPGGIAELGCRGDQTGRAAREIALQQPQHGLAVVDVGDGYPRCHGHRQDQAPGRRVMARPVLPSVKSWSHIGLRYRCGSRSRPHLRHPSGAGQAPHIGRRPGGTP
jgi:hypothetical protein